MTSYGPAHCHTVVLCPKSECGKSERGKNFAHVGGLRAATCPKHMGQGAVHS
jgi:hypothetical protein